MTDIATILPNAHAAFVDAKGLPTRAAYTFFRNLQTSLQQQISAIDANASQIADLQALLAQVQQTQSYWGLIAGDINDQDDLQEEFATKLTHPQVMARVSLGF